MPPAEDENGAQGRRFPFPLQKLQAQLRGSKSLKCSCSAS